MASVASLFNVPGGDVDADENHAWSFNHMVHHRDMNRVIYEITGQSLVEYSLDPWDPDNLTGLLLQHQIMHNNINAVLGTTGYNLIQVNWNDASARAAWIALNGQEHRVVSAIIGV